MHWRYGAFTSLDRRIRALLDLFRRLLLALSGNVERALEALHEIGDRYDLWDDEFGFEDFTRLLERRGEVQGGAQGPARLSPRGERALRRQALLEVFPKLKKGGRGEHRLRQGGGAGEPTDETRAYGFGDALQDLDTTRTLSNWLRRTGGRDYPAEEDLEVREREASTSCATVLLIDVSHSMTLYGEDRMTPARRVALALCELILTRFPKDTLDVVLFGDEAVAVPLEKLPYVTNGPFHTNTRAGLILAQEILRRRKGKNRQIVMITDGKPSAIHDENGMLYKNPFGLDRQVVAKTLEEAVRCRRKGISVTTFMMTTDPYLQQFVTTFSETCKGKAYLAQAARLESFVLVDFLRNRRRRVR
ncbi:MAG: VWA domain-containing protein [Planctomycetota bacterium]|nr:VWA domain-containing protein [Planctomycetota bacterium]